MRIAIGIAIGLGLTSVVIAKPLSYALPEETATLRPGTGKGFDAAGANCLSCHSPDYMAMQPPKKGQAFWDAEVQKMIKVYRAPIDEADVKAIVEYLNEKY